MTHGEFLPCKFNLCLHSPRSTRKTGFSKRLPRWNFLHLKSYPESWIRSPRSTRKTGFSKLSPRWNLLHLKSCPESWIHSPRSTRKTGLSKLLPRWNLLHLKSCPEYLYLFPETLSGWIPQPLAKLHHRSLSRTGLLSPQCLLPWLFQKEFLWPKKAKLAA